MYLVVPGMSVWASYQVESLDEVIPHGHDMPPKMKIFRFHEGRFEYLSIIWEGPSNPQQGKYVRTWKPV